MNHSTTSRPAPMPDGHAAGLRSAIAADPTASLVAGIQGAGGYGKTVLLEQLARTYRDAGVAVFGANELARADEGAVLVDDAHRLDETVLGELREIARRPGARLVFAYRPGPRPAALAELIGDLGAPVLLAALGREEIAAQAGGAAPEWIGWLHAQTGGVPRYVSRVLATAEPGTAELPSRALDQFQHDLDQLGEAGSECVTAMAVGATPHPDLLAALLELTPEAVGSALLAIRASGLVGADDVLLPIARAAALRLTPWELRLRVTRRLVEIQLARGGSVLPLVRPLLGAEIALLPESTLAAAFEKAGEEALQSAPHLARRLLAAAVSAGTPPVSVAARQARAAAVAGDLDEALRLADQVIVDDSVPDRELGVQVAASVLAHRGLLERSAELCRWSVGRLRWPGDRAFAAVGLIGAGRLGDAEELLRSSDDAGPPTSMTGAAAQLAAGVRESVVGSAATALSTLVRSASLSEPVGRGALVPDSPAAVAALVALHCGELDVVQSTLDKAIGSGSGGPLLHYRHRLLAAWLPLLRGDTVAARANLPVVELAARDRLLATAIEAGIASRDNDTAALAAARGRARQAVAEHSVDLFALLPLGELVVATARLRDQDWIAPYLAEARALLDRLGNPPLWTSMLTWKRLQAAVVLEELDEAQQLTAELGGMAHHNPLAAAMADASGVWLRILAGQVDQDEAEQAARALHAAGLAWDGARLAGQAAIRTADRRAMLALLECARALQGKPPRPRAVRGAMSAETDLLSEREKEVAELVLAGLTYKQVGKRLFISAKTVEHHISRIKQRLGCANREDLLNRLRELLGH
ncbi:LuxR C-terminal-related transcriptional regulator [Saccharopolyspora pogona]|uniref:LuxR C-terminal-related transcriptional regulator n=1 Tax=Saccharopolyspora pogona TaxID=333966 RepID=UPI001CC24AF1|nr:LuxR C-terminal-related transcriptional regulator [Saccharopolyspora pogona]